MAWALERRSLVDEFTGAACIIVTSVCILHEAYKGLGTDVWQDDTLLMLFPAWLSLFVHLIGKGFEDTGKNVELLCFVCRSDGEEEGGLQEGFRIWPVMLLEDSVRRTLRYT